jgi:hypothetical protein
MKIKLKGEVQVFLIFFLHTPDAENTQNIPIKLGTYSPN